MTLSKKTERVIAFVFCLTAFLISPAAYSDDSSDAVNINSGLDKILISPLRKPQSALIDKNTFQEESNGIDQYSYIIDTNTNNNEITATLKHNLINTPSLIILAENTISNDSKISTLKSQPKKSLAQTKKQNKYLKKSIEGKILSNESETWSCIEDTNNGLTWEIKSSDNGIRDKNNSYSWYQPSLLEGAQGTADEGKCKGSSDCDTQSYIQTMNKKNYCGYSDWRLPSREEMLSIVSFENAASKVTINTNYFPDTLPSWYWTASSNKAHPEHAWYVLFRNGIALNDLKERAKHIRLVRSTNSTKQVKL